MEECCENCLFWKRVQPDDMYPGEEDMLCRDDVDRDNERYVEVGQCRRYPPTLQAALIDYDKRTRSDLQALPIASYKLESITHYPMPMAYEWCGEWKAIT